MKKLDLRFSKMLTTKNLMVIVDILAFLIQGRKQTPINHQTQLQKPTGPYVVFSIGHPYWCEFYFDEDGKTTPLDKNNEYYRHLWEEEGSWQVLKIKKEITLVKTLEDRPNVYKMLNQTMPTKVADLL
jgi:hypothetical protein